MDPAAAQYIELIDPRHRPLFDRLHQLILARYPDVTVGYSYSMPTYRVDGRSLIVGVWKHGLSLYGMETVGAAAVVIDRVGLRSSKGTVHITPEDAGSMSENDLAVLVQVKLGESADD